LHRPEKPVLETLKNRC